ncbi:SelD-related putative sulfur metabolism protein [Acidilobus sp. 7A]|uniref:SelD-related putative sulfur metabolism protein n=1 Tax=Acidilobus sp. 7A TaxID=1577685 RepID=UPI000764E38E|nr:SelD-related putative sulfur metabolism protein [Acidilobus sp. 7A]AMD30875.1 selenophosphate synthase-like protein [Acidilobus sp. 7A]
MVRDDVREKLRMVKRMAAYYRSLGADPMSLAAGCSVKVDLIRVVYPAMKALRPRLGSSLEIAEREDSDVFMGDHRDVEVERLVMPLGVEAEHNLKLSREARAAVLIQVYQLDAEDPEKFALKVEPAYRSLSRCAPRIRIGKGHSIVTPFKEDEFMLADLVTSTGGDDAIAINNDTMHIIDPTLDPLDLRQVSGALSNALNDLFVLGIRRGLKIAPVLNAPTEELRERLAKNAEAFARSINAELVNVPGPGRGRLLMGATVIGYSDRQPPQFHHMVRPGMKVIATRSFGELAPITTYLTAAIDESVVDELESEGISFEELERLKEQAVNIISTPNAGAAEVIEKYLPRIGESYDPDEHIAATTDVTGPGIYVIKELAQLSGVTIKVDSVPLLFPQVSKFATEHFIMPNATAGTNGGFIIIAPEQVADDIVRDLSSRGYSPSIIGEVVSKGSPAVIAPKSVSNYIYDEAVLAELGVQGA